MPSWTGGWEIVVIAIVVLVLFGGSKLASAGKNAGRAIKEFKAEVREDKAPAVPETEAKEGESWRISS